MEDVGGLVKGAAFVVFELSRVGVDEIGCRLMMHTFCRNGLSALARKA